MPADANLIAWLTPYEAATTDAAQPGPPADRPRRRECPREPERQPARRVLAGARIRRDRALEPWTVAASTRKHEPRPINVDQPHAGGLYVAQRIGSPWSSHTASKTSGAPTGSCTVSRIRASRSSVGSMLSRTTPAPSFERALDRRPLVGVDVLAHDRMPHDGQLVVAERRRAPPGATPRPGRGATGTRSRSATDRAARMRSIRCELVGPDVGEQRELVVGMGRVERRQVAAGSRHDA